MRWPGAREAAAETLDLGDVSGVAAGALLPWLGLRRPDPA